MHLRTSMFLLLPVLLSAGCFHESMPTGPSSAQASDAPPKKKCTATYFEQLTEDQCDARAQDVPRRGLHQGIGSAEEFKPRVEEIQNQVPHWEEGPGVAAAVQMVTATHQHFSTSYVGDRPKSDHGGLIVEAFAGSGGKPIGRFVIITTKLSAGTFKLSPGNTRYIVSSILGEDLHLDSKAATNSMNKGSAMELTLRQAENEGDLEGEFKGKLVSKDGTIVHKFEAGYIYIKHEQ